MKTAVLSLMLAAATTPAWPAAAVNDKLAACTGIQDAQQRLACFDREMSPPAKAQAPSAPASTPAVTPAPAIAPAARPAVVAPAPSKPTLGEEQLATKLRPAPRQVEAVHARITQMRIVSPSTYAVTLDNGQTWRHENEHLGSFLREGDAVTVSKAAFGSYRLIRDAGDEKDWIRVTRIR